MRSNEINLCNYIFENSKPKLNADDDGFYFEEQPGHVKNVATLAFLMHAGEEVITDLLSDTNCDEQGNKPLWEAICEAVSYHYYFVLDNAVNEYLQNQSRDQYVDAALEDIKDIFRGTMILGNQAG